MRILNIALIALSTYCFASCAAIAQTQNNDDIYYSSSDKQTSTGTTEQSTSTAPADTYTYPETQGNDDEYRVYNDDFNSEKYYDEDGNEYIVNNYYYEDNYDDDYYYSNNLRRYYDPYYGLSYYSPYYSSYYYDPYSYWRGPGLYVGFGFGFGCYPYYAYNSYYPYYDPWYNPYYHNPYYGYYGGYGYNNAYWNGYYNGYYDGYYGNYYGYGNGYGNDGYYGGSSDNGYYYGPRNETASNTGNAGSGSDYYVNGVNKEAGNKTDIIRFADAENSAEVTRGGSDAPVVVAGSEKGGTTGVESGKVRVIKYYSADAAAAEAKDNAGRGSNTGIGIKTDNAVKNVNSGDYSPSGYTKGGSENADMQKDMPVQQKSNVRTYQYKDAQPANTNTNTYNNSGTKSVKSYSGSSDNSTKATRSTNNSSSQKSYSTGSSSRSSSGNSGSSSRSSSSSSRSSSSGTKRTGGR